MKKKRATIYSLPFFFGVLLDPFGGIGPRKWITNPFKKLRRIWSPHSIYFGWSSRLNNAPNSLFDILKSTRLKILIISSSRSWWATLSFLKISLLVICNCLKINALDFYFCILKWVYWWKVVKIRCKVTVFSTRYVLYTIIKYGLFVILYCAKKMLKLLWIE